MSKIEDALKRALTVRENIPAGNVSPTLKSSTTLALLSSEPAAGRDIARMVEPTVLGRSVLSRKRIVYPGIANNAVVNAFRQLRTRLLQVSEGRSMALMVTSARSGSGASFTALNLAAAFAFDNTKTALLIDCNLHDAGLNGLLYSKSEFGLIDYLEQNTTEVEEVIQPSGIPRLRWIPAGRRREMTTEVFTSALMRDLFQDLKNRYSDRYIIVDAPPITKSADAEILSDFCDYVLLVVPYGKATESQILAAAGAIDEKKLLGVVFNNTPYCG
jgi:protein-tyrosine kinase